MRSVTYAFFVVPGLYRHICKSILATELESEMSDSMVQLKLLDWVEMEFEKLL